MSNKKILLTLGIGYICKNITNVKKIEINDDLKCYSDKDKDLAVFISNNDIYEDLLVINFDKESKRMKVFDFCNFRELFSEFYSENNEIEAIKLVNSENNLSVRNYIKLEYNIIKEYVDNINGITLKLTPREARLLKLEINEDNKYTVYGEKLVEYLVLDYQGANKLKRLKKVFKILINNVLNLSKKEFINTISEIMSNIETSLSIKDLVSLGLFCVNMDSNSIEEYQIDIKEKEVIS